jgi:hypothetical protein
VPSLRLLACGAGIALGMTPVSVGSISAAVVLLVCRGKGCPVRLPCGCRAVLPARGDERKCLSLSPSAHALAGRDAGSELLFPGGRDATYSARRTDGSAGAASGQSGGFLQHFRNGIVHRGTGPGDQFSWTLCQICCLQAAVLSNSGSKHENLTHKLDCTSS